MQKLQTQGEKKYQGIPKTTKPVLEVSSEHFRFLHFNALLQKDALSLSSAANDPCTPSWS